MNKEQQQRAQERFQCVLELSAFYGTSFEDEYKMELAREAICDEVNQWRNEGLISWVELCNLESSVVMCSL